MGGEEGGGSVCVVCVCDMCLLLSFISFIVITRGRGTEKATERERREREREREREGKKTLMSLERAFRHMSAAVFRALRAVPRLVEGNTVPVKPLEVPT